MRTLSFVSGLRLAPRTLAQIVDFASASLDARAGTGSLWFAQTKATTSPRTMETLSRECPAFVVPDVTSLGPSGKNLSGNVPILCSSGTTSTNIR